MSVASRSTASAPRVSARQAHNLRDDDEDDQEDGRDKSSESENDNEEDEDDDNDDDDDDDDERDRRSHDQKRPVASWSVEEQDSVMEFYGLKTMYPQTWSDTRDQQSSDGNIPASDPLIPTSNPTPAPPVDDAPLDTSDPLGIRDSVIRHRGRRPTSHTHTESLAGPTTDARLDPLSSLLISSRTFDAKLFLRQVHRATSYRDLETGAENLKDAIGQKEDVIKNLVKTHFAKFVSAKSTIDSFYDQMKARNLISSQDYGIAPFDNAIDAVQIDATTLYKPLLTRRTQAEKIRSTLAVLSQWKFFFNLPSMLRTYLNKKKYDALVRDYQKGAYLMHMSFGEQNQNRRMNNNSSTTTATIPNAKEKDALLPIHHKLVFEKVWSEVTAIVEKAREKLFARLSENWDRLEVQEKYLTFLIDLKAEPDPVHMYLEKQYEWIQNRLANAYEEHVRVLEALANADTTSSRRPASVFTLAELRRALNIVRSQEFEVAYADDLHIQQLRATHTLIRTLTTILTDTLPEFWKLCRMYCGGRLVKKPNLNAAGETAGSADATYKKRRLDAKKLDMCHTRIATLVGAFTTMLAKAFWTDVPLRNIRAVVDAERTPTPTDATSTATPTLIVSDTDSPPQPSITAASASSTPLPQLPFHHAAFLTAHPLTACFFFIKIMAELVRCQDQFRAIRIVGDEEIAAALARGVASVRERAVVVVCEGVVDESRAFHKYEDWSFEQDTTTTTTTATAPLTSTSASLLPSTSAPAPPLSTASQPLNAIHALTTDSTTLLKLFYRLHTYVLRCLHRIVNVKSTTTTNSNSYSNSNNTNTSPAAAADHGKVKTCFDASMFAILDGLLWGAVCGETSYQAEKGVCGGGGVPGYETRALMGNTPIWKRRVKDLDIAQTDVRILVTLCNLQYLRKQAVPKLVALYHDKFGASTSGPDYQNLHTAMLRLDSLLFSNYIRRTASPLSSVIRNGILFEGLDWAGLTRPQEVRPYVFRLLLHLVAVHATVSAVSRALVRRVLQDLFLNLAADLLDAVRKVAEFSWGGLLQATLETQFIHQTLTPYETEATTHLLALVYDSIERGAGTDLEKATSNDHNDLDSEPTTTPHWSTHTRSHSQSHPPTQAQKDELLARVKLLLTDAKRATSVQFSCFREVAA
ncbi:exocyst complex component Sec5-domain-containing protein [Powellomyces hirtus]|nr:exocyst complex component Sec5-domain-containing protein [Powellomyces hirtus]